jgi:hypothetical protein
MHIQTRFLVLAPRPALRASLALTLLGGALATSLLPDRAAAQAAGKDAKPKEPKEEKQPTGETQVPVLFTAESPIAVGFRTNIRQIRRDKGENAPWRWGSLTYQDSAGKSVEVPLRVRTRGIWRLKNCEFPPIRFNFAGKDTKGTIFEGVDKPKLVNYCKDTDQYEQYMLQEAQLYRVYQLLTPLSHRVRVVKMTYLDSASGKRDAERIAMIIEDPDQLANRHMAKLVKVKGAGPSDVEMKEFALAYMFLYFIGNLDFSFNGLHNTELLGTGDGRILPVAYDFDYAGAVNASYAVPPPNYNVPNVRTRKFLAYCELAPEFPAAVAKLVEQKDAIYALYRDEVGKLLNPSVVRSTLEYFDDFYEQVRTPQDAERNVFRKCVRR